MDYLMDGQMKERKERMDGLIVAWIGGWMNRQGLWIGGVEG